MRVDFRIPGKDNSQYPEARLRIHLRAGGQFFMKMNGERWPKNGRTVSLNHSTLSPFNQGLLDNVTATPNVLVNPAKLHMTEPCGFRRTRMKTVRYFLEDSNPGLRFHFTALLLH